MCCCRRRRSGLVTLALALVATASCGDCKSRPPPPPDPAVFGEVAPREDADFAPYLAVARAAVAHEGKPAVSPPALPSISQRAFVTVWSPGEEPIVASAKGDTLAASVSAASEEAGKRVAVTEPHKAPRVEIDLLASAEVVSLDPGLREAVARVGTRGYVVATDAAHVGFVSPAEVMSHRYFDLSGEKDGTVPLATERLATTLAARAGIDRKALAASTVYAVTTTARVDAAAPGRALALQRGWPLAPPGPTGPGELLEATRAGAEYLARVIDARGNYRYNVRAVDPAPDRSYGWLRHAGSTYALLEAFAELGDPSWLQKSRDALAAIRQRMRVVPDVGAYLIDNADEEQQKVGGSGLALLALTKFTEITGEKDNLDAIQQLARLIVHQQYEDGHFRANADVEREDPTQRGKLKTEVMYYPGEATLGLVRAYAVVPTPAFLEAAKKSAEWMIHVRDAGKDDEHLLHDHWGCYALADLYRVTKNAAYAEHAFAIARAILKGETTADKAAAPDLAATFYAHGESTPTATRLEALVAVMEAARAMGKDTAWLDAAAMRYAVFLRAQQYDADRVFFTRDPRLLLGGVRESLLVPDVRIDYVQHAMSGWIHLAKLLRDPTWGTLPR
jgi:hypothetical protein